MPSWGGNKPEWSRVCLASQKRYPDLMRTYVRKVGFEYSTAGARPLIRAGMMTCNCRESVPSFLQVQEETRVSEL